MFVCKRVYHACVQVLMEAKKGVRPPEAGVIDAYKGVVNQTHNAGSKQA